MPDRDIEAYIQAARDLYENDDIEIDDSATLCQADNGTWVQAWVWVDDEKVQQ